MDQMKKIIAQVLCDIQLYRIIEVTPEHIYVEDLVDNPLNPKNRYIEINDISKDLAVGQEIFLHLINQSTIGQIDPTEEPNKETLYTPLNKGSSFDEVVLKMSDSIFHIELLNIKNQNLALKGVLLEAKQKRQADIIDVLEKGVAPLNQILTQHSLNLCNTLILAAASGAAPKTQTDLLTLCQDFIYLYSMEKSNPEFNPKPYQQAKEFADNFIKLNSPKYN